MNGGNAARGPISRPLALAGLVLAGASGLGQALPDSRQGSPLDVNRVDPAALRAVAAARGWPRADVELLLAYRSRLGFFEAAGQLRLLPGLRAAFLDRLWTVARVGDTFPADSGESNLVSLADASPLDRSTGMPRFVPGDGDTGDGRIDLNHADRATLARLPGCGSALASAILRARTAHGGFSRRWELLAVRGMTVERYRMLRQKLFVAQAAGGPGRHSLHLGGEFRTGQESSGSGQWNSHVFGTITLKASVHVGLGCALERRLGQYPEKSDILTSPSFVLRIPTWLRLLTFGPFRVNRGPATLSGRSAGFIDDGPAGSRGEPHLTVVPGHLPGSRYDWQGVASQFVAGNLALAAWLANRAPAPDPRTKVPGPGFCLVWKPIPGWSLAAEAFHPLAGRTDPTNTLPAVLPGTCFSLGLDVAGERIKTRIESEGRMQTRSQPWCRISGSTTACRIETRGPGWKLAAAVRAGTRARYGQAWLDEGGGTERRGTLDLQLALRGRLQFLAGAGTVHGETTDDMRREFTCEAGMRAPFAAGEFRLLGWRRHDAASALPARGGVRFTATTFPAAGMRIACAGQLALDRHGTPVEYLAVRCRLPVGAAAGVSLVGATCTAPPGKSLHVALPVTADDPAPRGLRLDDGTAAALLFETGNVGAWRGNIRLVSCRRTRGPVELLVDAGLGFSW